MCRISKLIKNYQNGDNESLMEIINKFSPLLKYAAYRANCEDVFFDWQLFFILLIKNLKLETLQNICDAEIQTILNKQSTTR